MDMPKGSCSQNTLKNVRLEHQSCRQERNFIDRDRLSEETHNRVQKPSDPECWSGGCVYVRLPP
jgi:hypothetical protein